MKATKDNFYKGTIAIWEVAPIKNFKSDYKSESGSQYMYTKEGVYRLSDHFGEIATCTWNINYKMKFRPIQDKGIIRRSNMLALPTNLPVFCKWEDFKFKN